MVVWFEFSLVVDNYHPHQAHQFEARLGIAPGIRKGPNGAPLLADPSRMVSPYFIRCRMLACRHDCICFVSPLLANACTFEMWPRPRAPRCSRKSLLPAAGWEFRSAGRALSARRQADVDEATATVTAARTTAARTAALGLQWMVGALVPADT